ncbi:MAG: 50S ribosomal protein L7/L12 [Candidatus Omnitrophica bacterium]|nr:50S ribosomal protein L7/L12 [Candidatus Omnitrophota bacterium]
MADEAKIEEAKTEVATAEPKTEDAQQESTETKKAPVELSDKAAGILSTVENMTVMELANLVKALEEKFGVTAAAPAVAIAGAVAGGGDAGAAEEQDSFNVVLTAVGGQKIQVIKEIRAITNLGLKEAKELVDSAPKAVKEGATKEEAEEIKSKLEAVGATIELK